jgi:hypothetical protein
MMPESSRVFRKKMCYWSVADGEHSKQLQALVNSARRVGCQEDFLAWSDVKIENATVSNPCGKFSKENYLFKITFLLNEAVKYDYDYFCWLDADNYFVRKPRSLLEHVNEGLVLVPMENAINSIANKRQDWWGVPTEKTVELFRRFGVKGKSVYNTNAGLFIVKKEFITSFCNMVYEFHYMISKLGYMVTEEYCIAIIGNLFNQDLEAASTEELIDIWACDWTGEFVNRLPTGEPWSWQNYLTGEKRTVNPAIVHLMRYEVPEDGIK